MASQTVDFIGERILDASSITNWSATKLAGPGGGWSATPSVTTDDFVQGTSSVFWTSANQANVHMYLHYDYTTANGTNLDFSPGGANEGQLLYIWAKMQVPLTSTGVATTLPGMTIALGSNGTSTSNIAWWNIYGSENYPGGWVRLVVDPRTEPTASGASFTISDVDYIGCSCTTIGTRAVDAFFIDAIDIGSGLYYYGTGTEDGFQYLLDQDANTINNSWGIIEELETTETVLLVRGLLEIGSGDVKTTFNSTDKVIAFDTPQHINSASTAFINSIPNDFVSIDIKDGGISGTDVTLGVKVGEGDDARGRNGITFVGNDVYDYGFNIESGTPSVSVYGTTFRNFSKGLVWPAESGHELAGSVIDNCFRFEPDSGLLIRNCTFLNHSSISSIDSGALLFTSNPPDDQVIDIKNCSFVANDRGIQHEVSGTFTYDGFSFSDNTFDVFFSTGTASDLVINVTNPVTPAASITATTGAAGSTVSFLSSFTLTITGFVDGSELFMRDATNGTTNIVERFNEESAIGSYEYTYDDALSEVDLFVLKATGDPNAPDKNDRPYQWLSFRDFELPAASQQLLVQQILDRNYSN